MIRFRFTPFLSILCAACGGGGEEAAVPARSVSSLLLSETVPIGPERYTGVVMPYRETEVGFEVTGRVEYVLDLGREVRGAILDCDGKPLLDEAGVPVEPGEILAVLDPKRYEQKIESLELQITSAELELASQTIDREEVAEQDLTSALAREQAAVLAVEAAREQVNAAQATFDLALAMLDRARELVEQGVQSQADLDRAVTEHETAQSTLAQAQTSVEAELKSQEAAKSDVAKARGTLKLKEAQIETTRSEIAQLRQSLETAQTDLEDCVLRAPFSGRITKAHVGRGALVQAGTPVVTLTLLDPMKVVFTVSAAEDRRIGEGTVVRIHVPGIPEEELADGQLPGVVREKGEVADPATRTFEIECMARNRRYRVEGSEEARSKRSWADHLAPVVDRFAGEGGAKFVFDRCLSGDGAFVLRVPGWNLLQSRGGLPSLFVPDRIPVRLGEEYLTFINWTFREVEADELRHGDMLVVDPRPEDEQGVRIARTQWILRPGDLVRVGLATENLTRGIYVPVNAIRERNGLTSVFLLEGNIAREREVRIGDGFGAYRRIEGEGIAAGARIAVQGMHYLVDGAPVRISGVERD